MARGILKVLRLARGLIYVEDQYLWSRSAVAGFCQALQAEPGLLLVAVLSHYPDQDGRFSTAPNLVGRYDAMRALKAAGGRRVAVYGLESPAGRPVYVHAKVCIVDDKWAKVGSDNINRRSWTHDSELACAVMDELPDGATSFEDGQSFAQDLRLELAREHLDRAAGDHEDLRDPRGFFEAFASSAAALEGWYAARRQGPRPSGRLRPIPLPCLSRWSRAWSTPIYRTIYDPDGRPRSWRRQGRF